MKESRRDLMRGKERSKKELSKLKVSKLCSNVSDSV